MALVTRLERVRKARQKVHGTVDCEVSVFEEDGASYVQLDTFGSASRKERGKISQSLQLGAEGAAQLRAILDEAFPLRR